MHGVVLRVGQVLKVAVGHHKLAAVILEQAAHGKREREVTKRLVKSDDNGAYAGIDRDGWHLLRPIVAILGWWAASVNECQPCRSDRCLETVTTDDKGG